MAMAPKLVKVVVKKAFPYSPHGWDLVHVGVGERELPADIAKIAIEEKWAVAAKPPTPPGS